MLDKPIISTFSGIYKHAKNHFMIMKITSLFFLIFVLNTNVLSQTLVVPPNPGNLGAVAHLKQSDDYSVEVKKNNDTTYLPCFVYKTDNYAGNMFNSEHRIQEAVSFTNFSFSKTSVDVKIKCNFNVNSVTIRPLNLGITSQIKDNVISIKLKTPQKISVEINNRLNPLFILADAPDVPNTKATYYYGPGIHDIGLKKQVKSNESVYIAGGAVVQGTFKFSDSPTNIKFSGRGIITTGNLPHESNNLDSLIKYSTFAAENTQFPYASNLTFEGLTLVNGAAWTFTLANTQNHDNTFDNLKLISWCGNTDGIWIAGDNHTVDNCFIFNNDDAFASHGSTNCKISNVTVWGGAWGRVFFHQFGASSDNVLFDNIDVIGKDGGTELILVSGSSKPVQNINNFTFKNLRIEDSVNSKLLKIDLVNNKHVTNWFFENITIDKKNAKEGYLYGTSKSLIDGITFRNLKMAGKYVKSFSEANMDKNGYVSNLIFEVVDPIVKK